MRNLTKTLVSGIWILSPEAWGTAGRDPGERGNLGEPPSVTAFKKLCKNPLEIPKGIPSWGKTS